MDIILNLYNKGANDIESYNFKYYYLFKKKKENKNKLNYFNLFKISFFYNVYMQYLYIDSYFFQYNIIKNYWILLILNYNNKNNKFKIKIRKLFNLFCKKSVIKNILGLKIKKKYFSLNFFYN